MATSHESLPVRARSSGSLTRLPPVRLPSREELTAAARVAPLLRVARDLAAWAGSAQAVGAGGDLTDAGSAAAAFGFLAKGPVAPAIALLVIAAFYVWNRRSGATLAPRANLLNEKWLARDYGKAQGGAQNLPTALAD